MVKFSKGGQNRLFSQIPAIRTKTRKNTPFLLNLGTVAKTSEYKFFSLIWATVTKPKKNTVFIQFGHNCQK